MSQRRARRDWRKEKTWGIRWVSSGMPLRRAPRLFAGRSSAANPKRSFDPAGPPIIGDFTSVFAVGPVWVVVELGDFGGRLEPIRIEVRGYASLDDQEAFPVTASTLRRIRPGELVRLAVEEREDVVASLLARSKRNEPDAHQLKQLVAARARVADAGRTASGRSGPLLREQTEQFWNVIDAYSRACSGGSKSPNVDVAIALGMSKWTVRKYVARARSIGVLAKTEPRVPNGRYAPGRQTVRRDTQ